ncbi:MAG: hypothetical protein PPHEESC_4231 [uncultured Paraburkholderia sp.]|nr:MAG: hypothetical protein PPHEESC_4231 [uncultured Paraburkholderia sp.]CAH2932273.1 MAG: hypothetical protein PPHEMADMSA_4005 [uncultured Paraburkholderia sp.]CAH2933958.1 MAG: hypothetical protein PPHERAN_4116 [uncultured Paraburkholderia sp.]
MGLSLVPESMLPVARQGLRVLSLATPIYREFHLVSSEAGRSSPAVRAFFDEARRTRSVTRLAAHGRTAPVPQRVALAGPWPDGGGE